MSVKQQKGYILYVSVVKWFWGVVDYVVAQKQLIKDKEANPCQLQRENCICHQLLFPRLSRSMARRLFNASKLHGWGSVYLTGGHSEEGLCLWGCVKNLCSGPAASLTKSHHPGPFSWPPRPEVFGKWNVTAGPDCPCCLQAFENGSTTLPSALCPQKRRASLFSPRWKDLTGHEQRFSLNKAWPQWKHCPVHNRCLFVPSVFTQLCWSGKNRLLIRATVSIWDPLLWGGWWGR